MVVSSGTGRFGRCDLRPWAAVGAAAGEPAAGEPAATAGPAPGGAPASGWAGRSSWLGRSRVGATTVSLAARPTPAARAASPAPSPAASDDSYSGTVPKTGSPADAASDRAAASPDTIDSRRLFMTASRDRSRKFIREVAIRDPYGTTSATRVPAADRIRCAADVISSSTSR